DLEQLHHIVAGAPGSLVDAELDLPQQPTALGGEGLGKALVTVVRDKVVLRTRALIGEDRPGWGGRGGHGLRALTAALLVLRLATLLLGVATEEAERAGKHADPPASEAAAEEPPGRGGAEYARATIKLFVIHVGLP